MPPTAAAPPTKNPHPGHGPPRCPPHDGPAPHKPRGPEPRMSSRSEQASWGPLRQPCPEPLAQLGGTKGGACGRKTGAASWGHGGQQLERASHPRILPATPHPTLPPALSPGPPPAAPPRSAEALSTPPSVPPGLGSGRPAPPSDAPASAQQGQSPARRQQVGTTRPPPAGIEPNLPVATTWACARGLAAASPPKGPVSAHQPEDLRDPGRGFPARPASSTAQTRAPHAAQAVRPSVHPRPPDSTSHRALPPPPCPLLPTPGHPGLAATSSPE